MCLPIAVDRPDCVLGKGEHLGHEWMVVHNGMGYRCGYVKVEPGHPWHGKDYNSLDDVEVHGGLTFADADKPCDKGGPDNGWWLGFDCCHYLDMPDTALPSEHGMMRFQSEGVVRSQEYVEAECRSLCEQAARAAA